MSFVSSYTCLPVFLVPQYYTCSVPLEYGWGRGVVVVAGARFVPSRAFNVSGWSGPCLCGAGHDQRQSNAALSRRGMQRRAALLQRLSAGTIAADATPVLLPCPLASNATGGRLYLPERRVKWTHRPRELMLHTMQ